MYDDLQVINRVAHAFGQDPKAITGQTRIKSVARARHVAMYLLKEIGDLRLTEIGRLFGGRDHSTVIHSIRRAQAMVHDDPEFEQQVEELRRQIEAQFDGDEEPTISLPAGARTYRERISRTLPGGVELRITLAVRIPRSV